MKDEIKILFLNSIGHYLKNENLKYIVNYDNDNYIVNKFPIIYTGHINSIFNNLCYDFDELSNENKKKYGDLCIILKRINNNVYSVQTKTYSIKRFYFPKQN